MWCRFRTKVGGSELSDSLEIRDERLEVCGTYTGNRSQDECDEVVCLDKPAFSDVQVGETGHGHRKEC